jgi:CAAX prenyl protease-like protein
MISATPQEKAYVGPLFVFLLAGALGSLVEWLSGMFLEGDSGPWMLSETRYWVMPLQILAGGAFLIRYWRYYTFRPITGLGFATLIGAIALIIWIAPQEWLGFAPRYAGFNPERFGGPETATYWMNVILRFFRLVIIVPLVEEIFWRGFLLRYMVDDDFTDVPMGTFTWKSFGIVVAGFCVEHNPPDYPAAILTGVLFNLVAYRTKSLAACVLTHAVTNLILGIYIMRTGQWGFW